MAENIKLIRNKGGKYKIVFFNKEFPTLSKLTDDVIMHLTNGKPKGNKDGKHKAVIRTCAYFEIDLPVVLAEIKRQYDKFVDDDLDFIPDNIRVLEKDPEPIETKSFSDISNLIAGEMGEDAVQCYKKLLATVVSMWYADTESIYMMVIAMAGSGKSTICDFFQYCREYSLLLDSITTNALEPGTATKDQEAISTLDLCSDKTLIIHDLTAIFSDSPAKVMKLRGITEAHYGKKDGYRKGSPGPGLRVYGKRLNHIFAVNPQTFFATFPYDKKPIGFKFTSTQRCIYATLEKRDHSADFLSNKEVTTEWKKDIARRTQGFLEYLEKVKGDITIDKPLVEQVVEAYFTSLPKDEFNYVDGTQTRRYKQCIQFCKALALIDGEEKINESHVKMFGECLEMPPKPDWLRKKKKKKEVTDPGFKEGESLADAEVDVDPKTFDNEQPGDAKNLR